jgi:16S rRNA (cytosine1402-N4)-methyltransferase
VSGLSLSDGAVVVDATYGRGGHSALLLEAVGDNGRLLVVDQDPAAIEHARRVHGEDPRVSIHHDSFADLARIVADAGLTERLDGVLLDLGVSSPQLDDAGRGFSFSAGGPLDMRMNPAAGESAAEWLAQAPAEAIADVLRTYGEERFAKRIARAIVAERDREPIEDTARLAEIIRGAVPASPPGRHPATRSFQAIRIHINRELEALDTVLESLPGMVRPGGRMAVISFHSLEDRRVKQFIRGAAGGPKVVAGVPLPDPEPPPFRGLGKAIRASEAERDRNPRARSAVLRIAERRA